MQIKVEYTIEYTPKNGSMGEAIVNVPAKFNKRHVLKALQMDEVVEPFSPNHFEFTRLPMPVKKAKVTKKVAKKKVVQEPMVKCPRCDHFTHESKMKEVSWDTLPNIPDFVMERLESYTSEICTTCVKNLNNQDCFEC